MDENWLQIHSYEGAGFQPLVAFNAWRVAILNYLDDLQPECNTHLERHTQTDEVFVLIKGRGILILGGNTPQVEEIYPQAMEIGKIYNVRINTWHTILLDQDASVLIVEEQSTGKQNTEFFHLTSELHRKLIGIARKEKIGN